MGLFTRAVLAVLPHVPKPIMRRIAARYIAGETLDEALQRITQLQASGYTTVLDVLGEGIADESQARAVAKAYCEAATELARRKLDAYVSVKPTHVGLSIDENLAYELYAQIAAHCAPLGQFLRVEMEDAPTKDGTLRVFERLRQTHTNVGIVLQSRLFCTKTDIQRLAPGPLDVRLVKGIYLEPASIAHTEAEPIRVAYIECLELLCQRAATLSLATHDDGLAARALAVLAKHAYRREQYEFQTLMGVREELWSKWKDAGHRVRVYVPFGPEWRPYSLRRMRKNPQIVGHVMRQMFRL
jgi:proline dehydrogenase